MSIETDTCETCSNIDNADIECDPTFSPSSVSWLGYGLDRYGPSAYGSPSDVLPVIKREVFALLSGYKVKYQHSRKEEDKFPLNSRVYVYSSAENKAYKVNKCSVGYYVTVRHLKHTELTASVDTKHVTLDLGASVYILTPAFEHGKTLTMELNCIDNAGNQMLPFVIVFTIEEES